MTNASAEIKARLARIAKEDAYLNSFVRVFEFAALRDAKELDTAAVNGAPHAPLSGLPIGVKDNFAVQGTSWTAGIKGRHDFVAERDATAVARLRTGGAILLGALNMDEAAFGAVADNPVFGRCMNPLRNGFSPGGSSGGSAAAVAAGFIDLALGSDTLGSVRIPAAYCGVVGLTPTSGLIGRGGLALLAPSLDTIGVLTWRANLLWPAMTTLAGSDTDDPRSARVPLEWDQRSAVSDLSTLRFGIPKQLELVNCEPAICAGFATARRVISELGATIVDVDMPVWHPAAARHAGLLVIEAEGAVELGELLNTESALSTSLQQMLRYGAALTADRLDAAYATIRGVGGSVARAWQDVDALLMPTTPQRAFAHGISPPTNQAELTALANFSGCPAVTLPVWDNQSDLPAAVQLIAPKWSESRLTSWAEILESAVRVTHLPTPTR